MPPEADVGPPGRAVVPPVHEVALAASMPPDPVVAAGSVTAVARERPVVLVIEDGGCEHPGLAAGSGLTAIGVVEVRTGDLARVRRGGSHDGHPCQEYRQNPENREASGKSGPRVDQLCWDTKYGPHLPFVVLRSQGESAYQTL